MNSRQRVWFLDEIQRTFHSADGAASRRIRRGFSARVAAGFSFGRVVRDHPHFFRRRFCADFRLRLPVFPQQSAPGRTVPFTGGRAVRHHRFSDPRPAGSVLAFCTCWAAPCCFLPFYNRCWTGFPPLSAPVWACFFFSFVFRSPADGRASVPCKYSFPAVCFKTPLPRRWDFPGRAIIPPTTSR